MVLTGYSDDNQDNLGKIAHDAWQVEGKQCTSLPFPFLRLSNSVFRGHHSLTNIYFLEGGDIEARSWARRDLSDVDSGYVFHSKIWASEWQLVSQERAHYYTRDLYFEPGEREAEASLCSRQSLLEVFETTSTSFWAWTIPGLSSSPQPEKYFLLLSELSIAKWTVYPSCGKKMVPLVHHSRV